MPFLFTCPHCQTQTQVDDRYSGQSGKCVTCGGAIELPKFAAGSTVSPSIRGRGGVGRERIVRWLVAGAVGVVLTGSLLAALFRVGGQTVSQLTTNRERTSSMRNLERIAKALNAYAADFGTYPPSATRTSSGQALHSWRVLILPYLGEDELYNRFDLSVPWDDASNMRVAYDMPAYYRDPTGGTVSPYLSAYYRILGPGTILPSTGPLSRREITDDASQTILVIEGTPIVPSGLWTEPIDLDVSMMQGRLSANPGIEPGGIQADGVVFATVDERTHFVPSTFEPRTILALITANGGERLPDDTLD